MKEILLTRGHKTVVDDEDYDRLNVHKWCVTDNSRWVKKKLYAMRRRKKSDGPGPKNIYMHREIMRPDKGMVVDHSNGNSLDNRRCNLRICTPSENNMCCLIRQKVREGL